MVRSSVGALVACGLTFALALASGASAGGAAAEERHAMRGVVLKVDPASQTIVVSTENVPGFMAAMAMPFTVTSAAVLKTLVPGATIEFVGVMRPRAGPGRGRSSAEEVVAFAENIRVTAYENLEQEPLELRRLQLLTKLAAPATAVKRLMVDQPVPDFTLTDQHHQPVTFSTLSGKVVAVTFAYMRCPNPAYCFRLAANFGQLQKRFEDRLGRDLVLLTVVIDPEHDEKGALADYARIWTTNPAWHFLTGPVQEIQRVAGRFGVEFWKDEGLLVHSFGTVVVDRQGRLAANLEGNQFSAKQLGDLVQSVIDRPKLVHRGRSEDRPLR
jgi:protein SCO1/2